MHADFIIDDDVAEMEHFSMKAGQKNLEFAVSYNDERKESLVEEELVDLDDNAGKDEMDKESPLHPKSMSDVDE